MRRPQLVHCVGRLPRVRRRPVQQDQEVHRGPLLLPRRDGRYLEFSIFKQTKGGGSRLTGGRNMQQRASDVFSEGRSLTTRGIATYANEAYKVRGDRVSSSGPGCVNLRENGPKFTSAVPRARVAIKTLDARGSRKAAEIRMYQVEGVGGVWISVQGVFLVEFRDKRLQDFPQM